MPPHASHEHATEHRHDDHARAEQGTLGAFRIGTALNLALVAVQVVAGFWLGSVALLGDAAHNATDVLGLMLAWGAARLALRRPTRRHTYGMARSTILAALLNAALLLIACGALAWESIGRFAAPPPIAGWPVMAIAALGVLVNAGSAALFYRARRSDLNARGAFLHLAADAAVSLAVVLAGAAMALTGWYWIDPATGLAIAAVVLWSGWGLLRESLDLALDAVPRGVDLSAIEDGLRSLAGVLAVHDLHVWALSTTVNALTVHVEHDGSRATDTLLAEAQNLLESRFGIGHSTIQFENLGCARRC
jgi:cobalt-zinc-cadmium efflux system protein